MSRSSLLRLLSLFALTFTLPSLCPAAPVPHPDRPDRLVETRDGRSIEYSPGQEAWMEMAFEQMKTVVNEPIATPPTARRTGPAVPGSAQYLKENRDVILTAIARQTGLPTATELQGRTFDTFLGYYDMMTEMMQTVAEGFPSALTARHMAIWQRDDLVERLRTGAKIEGMSYDPATDSGRFEFNRTIETPALKKRFAVIQAAIEQQRLKHTFDFDKASYSASVTLNTPPAASKAPASATEQAVVETPVTPDLVIPIIYRGDPTTLPSSAAFAHVGDHLRASVAAIAEQATTYRNPAIVGIILHETAEIGLVENIIASRDRRWLCEGTANYVAWRVTRDLCGADFARQVYDVEAQFRFHAEQQPKIDLADWSAVESQNESEREANLNKAHYAFATRTMFLLAERHGENALAQLWADVASTPKKRASAKTFTDAYRKRFKADLAKLVREAQQKTIPTESTPTK